MINSMLINSGLEEEQDQWGWLEQTLQELRRKQGVHVFTLPALSFDHGRV